VYQKEKIVTLTQFLSPHIFLGQRIIFFAHKSNLFIGPISHFWCSRELETLTEIMDRKQPKDAMHPFGTTSYRPHESHKNSTTKSYGLNLFAKTLKNNRYLCS